MERLLRVSARCGHEDLHAASVAYTVDQTRTSRCQVHRQAQVTSDGGTDRERSGRAPAGIWHHEGHVLVARRGRLAFHRMTNPW